MISPKIFISHSTRTESNFSLLNRICEELHKQGFNVLVDRRTIGPGDAWFACINEWMYECHSAVILLSEAALCSTWVQAEAVVTSNRKWNEPEFRLIVIPLESVTDTIIKDHPFFGHVARLADIQFLRNCIDDNDILCKLVAALNGLRSYNSPFEKLAALIGQTLSRIQDEALENAIDKLVRPTPQRNHAEMLARALFREPGKALYNLRIVLIELTHLIDRKLANRLLDMLQGIWVQAEAAVNLKNARNDATAVAINCSQLEYFTGRCYARRAWPFPTQIKCISAGPARSFAQVRSVLLQEFGKAIPDPRRAEMRLKNWQKNNSESPILLMFPAPESVENGPSEETFPDQALLDDLGQNYPAVTVLLGTGSEIPDSLSYVISLRPLLPEGEEEYQYERYEDLLDCIRDLPL